MKLNIYTIATVIALLLFILANSNHTVKTMCQNNFECEVANLYGIRRGNGVGLFRQNGKEWKSKKIDKAKGKKGENGKVKDN